MRTYLAQQPCRLPSVHPTFKNVFGLQRFGDKPAPEGVREPHAERVHADGAVRVDVVDKLLQRRQYARSRPPPAPLGASQLNKKGGGHIDNMAGGICGEQTAG